MNQMPIKEHRESPSMGICQRSRQLASQSPNCRASNSTLFTKKKSIALKKKKRDDLPRTIQLTSLTLTQLGLPVTLPPKESLKRPTEGEWHLGEHQSLNLDKSTILNLSTQKQQEIHGTQERQTCKRQTKKCTFSSKTPEDDDPLKHCMSLSFHKIQMMAKKEILHIILPLADPSPSSKPQIIESPYREEPNYIHTTL